MAYVPLHEALVAPRHLHLDALLCAAEAGSPLIGSFLCRGTLEHGPCSEHCGQLFFSTPHELGAFLQTSARGTYGITAGAHGVILNSLQ